MVRLAPDPFVVHLVRIHFDWMIDWGHVDLNDLDRVHFQVQIDFGKIVDAVAIVVAVYDHQGLGEFRILEIKCLTGSYLLTNQKL